MRHVWEYLFLTTTWDPEEREWQCKLDERNASTYDRMEPVKEGAYIQRFIQDKLGVDGWELVQFIVLERNLFRMLAHSKVDGEILRTRGVPVDLRYVFKRQGAG